jgi:hypothetical protein
MNTRVLFDKWLDIVFILVILISSISAITYYNSKPIFDANIMYVNNVKQPYYVILEIKNKNLENLKYNVEILYKNKVINDKSFNCKNTCEKKLILNKIFFDKYDVIITAKNKNKIYKKELHFKFNKFDYDNKVFLKPTYKVKNLSNISIYGKLFLIKPSDVILEAVYSKNDSIKFKKKFFCNKSCDFNLQFKKNVLFGKYILKVYLPYDAFSKDFNLVYFNNTGNYKNEEKKDLSKIIAIINNSNSLEAIDVFGDKIKLNKSDIKDFLNLSIKGIYDKNNTNLTNNSIKFKPKIKEIKNINNISNENVSTIVQKKDGFTKISSYSKTTLNPEANPVVYNDTKIYVSSKDDKYFNNISDIKKENSKKLIPGVYKIEKIVRYKDGSEVKETKYFAYGLVSINTLKPLYHPNETVNMLIVVLDSRGFLVSNANITLNITTPSGKVINLSTDNLDILETKKSGVYNVSFKLNGDVGKYKLHVETEEDDMIVDVDSYFNVVKYYPFDILREVPATIDPWQGPFSNNFTIIPLFNYHGIYTFTEQFSSDFTDIRGNYDYNYTKNGTTYLVWKNLHGVSHLTYTAQTPLKSPYLYYLGKSYINYNENLNTFYENRSWLFAIDPAAKVCGDKSICACGAACSGGNEPGDGTIDSCTDGDTEYEYVNDIRVKDLNGSYFGTGDTVEICVDFNCDSDYGGDVATIGYKDASNGWINGDIVYETGTTDTSTACVGQQTYCVNVTLTDYVGTHNVRGKVVWDGKNGKICDTSKTFYDHDDINFTVIKRRPSYYTSYDLDNGTNIGDNLNIIRGFNVTAFAHWDRPLQEALITHNGEGIFKNYSIYLSNENWTNYTLNTFNITEFNHVGPVNLNITSWDLYFNLTNTTPIRTFYIYGSMKINQSEMEPYIMYNGTRTNISCQVTDEQVGVPYSNVNVSFYNNVSGYLGSALTNSSGWANISYIENNVGTYTITCNVSNQLSDYLVKGKNFYSNMILTVKKNGTDITPPKINSVQIDPSQFSVGGVTTITANVTDETNLTSVYLNVTLPDGSDNVFEMQHISGDLYTFNFTNTTQDGIYKYYIYAFDNSSNKGWSSTYSFLVTGIRTFIGIETTKNSYKLGETINLTPYSKIYDINNSIIKELGDVDHFYYDFETGFENWSAEGSSGIDWANGVPSKNFINKCDSGNCIVSNLTGDYQPSVDEWFISPVYNFSGRSNLKVTYWRMVEVEDGTDQDRAFFEGYDGSSWNVYYQDSLQGGGGPYQLDAGYSTYYTPELEGVENAQYRFRLYGDGDSNVYDGWGIDSVNISFDPRKDWIKKWVYYNNSFGTDVSKVTALIFTINITNYSSIGSEKNKDDLPDLELQIFNGTNYTGDYRCNLDSSKSYPFKCDFVIKNTPEYLNAWKKSLNRSIRIRAINLDHGDYIYWTNVSREYVTPSIIENHGESKVTSYLLEQFKNDSGGIVKTMYNNSITLNSSESKELDTYWNFFVPYDFKLGKYLAYVALTDADNNVIYNDDDNTPINDSYAFYVRSLLINVINPQNNSVQKENFLANLSLDTTYYNSGGWCAYNMDNSSNISMIQESSTSFDKLISNVPDGNHSIIFYCNDSDNYIIRTLRYNFFVSEKPRLSFVSPTDLNNSYVNRSWTYINVSINESSNNSAFIDFNKTLIGYWNFEDVSGTTVYDKSTYGNNGVLKNGVKINSSINSMIRGKYAVFDGIDDYVEISSSKELEVPKTITISSWINWRGDGDDLQNIFTNGGWTNALRVVNDGSSDQNKILFQLNINGSTKYLYSNTLINPNLWYNIIGIYNGSAMKIYINGILDSELNATGNIKIYPYDNYIGTEYSNYYFNGSIDEVMIFNRSLTENEIKSLYNGNINKYVSNNFTNLLNGKYSYYACDIDKIGNFNCTENRVININKSLPDITILSPLNNSKHSILNTIWFNVSLKENSSNVDKVWFEINNNGTKYYLSNVTEYNWSNNLTLSTGHYNVTFYGNDTVGNMFKSKTNVFFVYPDKKIKIKKYIFSLNNNIYKIKLEIYNFGFWRNYTLLDYIPTNCVAYNFSKLYNDSFNISVGNYKGKYLLWNLSLTNPESLNVSYYINITNSTKISDLYLTSLD